MNPNLIPASLLAACLGLTGCDTPPPAPAGGEAAATPAATSPAAAEPVASEPTPASAEPGVADRFMAAIASHCWRSYAGKIVANEPADANDPFADKPLVMHVRECSENEIRIPFHVGDDRSRTWVLTRTAGGLRLKHDHRHADGSADALTWYGGDSRAEGTVERHEFPADDESKALFDREGRSVSNDNVWAIEIEPQQRLVYELARPGRLFRVEFDLTSTVTTPPDPWSSVVDSGDPR